MTINVTSTEVRLHVAIAELDASVAKLQRLVDADPEVAADPHLTALAEILVVGLAHLTGRSAVDTLARARG